MILRHVNQVEDEGNESRFGKTETEKLEVREKTTKRHWDLIFGWDLNEVTDEMVVIFVFFRPLPTLLESKAANFSSSIVRFPPCPAQNKMAVIFLPANGRKDFAVSNPVERVQVFFLFFLSPRGFTVCIQT